MTPMLFFTIIIILLAAIVYLVIAAGKRTEKDIYRLRTQIAHLQRQVETLITNISETNNESA